MLTEFAQNIVIIAVFFGVILAIAFDVIDMLLAALLGISVLIIFGIFDQQDVINVTRSASGPLALLFGGMVVARVLVPTGIFEYIGSRYLLATQGSGKRFILSLFLLVGPLCAVLPNATTVILLAPIIIRVAQAMKIDIVGPMIITAIISNSAGLLTLVGDPATFLVGSSIGMTFIQYVQRVSLGGLLSVIVLIPLLPWLMKDLWQVQRPLPPDLKPEPLQRPYLCLFALLILVLMVILFVAGELLPARIVPPAVSIIAASLALLLVYEAEVEPVTAVLQDVDWRTILFIISLFCLVEAFNKTGILQGLSQSLYVWFGTRLVIISLVILAIVGVCSALLANIPVVAVMLLMVKGYFVIAELMPETAMAASFVAWPTDLLPVFVAMMFAGTLGGNATLIGASANVVAAGICASHGRPISFMTFMRYGLPLTICQLVFGALYVLILFSFVS
ncbi:MAG: citrate transporter [Deltaproteobacteria bacterium]|nr:citrate transporter [Deltaproteobacteria bacterium]